MKAKRKKTKKPSTPFSNFSSSPTLPSLMGATSVCVPFDKPDAVNHPPHYRKHPSGVECITVTEHMNFCLGNAVKYIWRAGEKGDAMEDLKKARWYLDREIARREKEQAK